MRIWHLGPHPSPARPAGVCGWSRRRGGARCARLLRQTKRFFPTRPQPRPRVATMHHARERHTCYSQRKLCNISYVKQKPRQAVRISKVHLREPVSRLNNVRSLYLAVGLWRWQHWQPVGKAGAERGAGEC